MLAVMPIVTQCTAPGCETLTIGRLCVEHETLPARAFVRGRPLVSASWEIVRPFGGSPAPPASLRKVSVRQAAAPLPR